MNDTWKNFLLQRGANYQDGAPRDFGDPASERRAARDNNVLTDLSSLALLRVGGADAKAFLNGQLTNDIEALDASHHRLAAWCTAQGRMLAVFRMFSRAENYYLQFPASLRDDTVKRLRMFVLRAKVTIENADAELARIGLSGPTANLLLREATGISLDADNACVTRDALTVLRLPGPHPRFEIIVPVGDATSLWEKLQRDATAVGTGVWAWLDIQAGIPTVLPETKEAFVPQMANLELVDGVNFKKGCYPGQEIVARMQYLGRLKQRMVRVRAPLDSIVPGTPIYAPDFPGQSAGTVVDAQPSPDNGSDLLAVVQISSVQNGELHLGSESGPRLEIQSLPYAVGTKN